MTQLVRVDMHT